MESLRKPFFFMALALILLALLLEAGAVWLVAVEGATGGASLPASAGELPDSALAIPYLALLDGLLVYIMSLMGAALVVPARIQGRIQGAVTLVVSILVLVGAITSVTVALALLTLMVSLLTAVPFGTLIYLAKYADFDLTAAQSALALLMALKLGFAGCLALSHPRFFQNTSLIFLILTSLAATAIVSLLHGLVPRFLVSITDCIAAIVVAVLAAVWAVLFLLGAVVSIGRVLRVDKALG